MKYAVALVISVGSLVAPNTARGAGEALPIKNLTPANGVRVPRLGTTGSITFRLTSPITYLDSVWIEVSTRRTRGQDGTLADRYQVDFIDLFQSYSHPRRYSGPSDGNWTNRRGRYYWQIYARGTDPDTAEMHEYVGPLRSLRIVKRCGYVKRHGHRRKVCS